MLALWFGISGRARVFCLGLKSTLESGGNAEAWIDLLM